MRIVFCKPRQPYQSYTDLWTIAALSGYPVLYVDEINWQDSSLVVIGTPANHEWDTVIPERHNAYLVHLYLERPGIVADPSDMAYPARHDRANDLWTCDRAVARHLDCKYMFLGGHAALGKVYFRTAPHYDFCTLAYHNGRRSRIVDDLRLQGLSWADASGGVWGEDRQQRLHDCLMCINIHQDDQLWHEPIRFAVLASYALPILSEPCADPGLFVPGIHYLEAATADLACTAQVLKGDSVARARLAANAWRLVNDTHPFRACVEQALNA